MRFNINIVLLVFILTIPECIFSQISFLPFQSIAIDGDPKRVYVKDLNNDGLDDVIVSNSYHYNQPYSNQLFIFYQNSNGSLNSPVIYSYPLSYGGLQELIAEDVNNDGLIDIVIAFTDSIGIYFQNQFLTFNNIETYYSGPNVSCMRVGDLNNDGLNDIIVAHYGTNSYIKIFYQTINGFIIETSQSPSFYGGFMIAIGDINNDSRNDVILAKQSQPPGFFVYPQNSSGQLNIGYIYQNWFPTNSNIFGIDVGDLNNNGYNDIVATNGKNMNDAKLYFWFQDTITNNFQSSYTEIDAFHIPTQVKIRDLNCDGRNEIIVAHNGWHKITVYEHDSTNNYNSYFSFNAPYISWTEMFDFGDINGDGMVDIVLTDEILNITTFINNSTPSMYTLLDTIVTQNLYTSYIADTSIYVNSFEEIINNYNIIKIDSFFIISTIQKDSLTIDSLFISEGHLCSNIFTDTLIKSSHYNYTTLINTDTILYSSYRDSTNIFLNIEVYPNPTKGIITIELPDPHSKENLIIKIFNYLGQLIYKESIQPISNKRRIDISEFSNGSYYLKIYFQDFSFQGKFIKIE